MTATTCRELIEFLDDYVAGELPANRLSAFTHHLSLCASCRAYLASYRVTIHAARSSSHTEIEDVPAEVLTAILATITSRK
jgi:anti-sigma factor RsiW